MGWRTNRKAKKLPDLIAELERGRTSIAANAENPDLADQQRDEARSLLPKIDAHIEKARGLRDEFDASGTVADPGFLDWYKVAQDYAILSDTPLDERLVAVQLDERRLSGGV